MSKRSLRGVISAAKMNETAIVKVAMKKQHPIYLKRFIRHESYPAHNPANLYQVGDEVRIEETRPISKTKRWIIRERLSTSVAVPAPATIDTPVISETTTEEPTA